MIALACCFVVGLVVWTLLEYVLHRFGGHEKRFGRAVQKEHLAHHARPDTFATTTKKLVLAIPVLSSELLLLLPLLGLTHAAVVVAGTASGWWFYEALHRATHVWGPWNPYGAWARRHHLHHHFGNPGKNHGVTSPLWDFVFGTLEQPETVRVPKVLVHAFPWLIEKESGQLRSRFAGRYRLG